MADQVQPSLPHGHYGDGDTLEELKRRAQREGIRYWYRLSRVELIDALEEVGVFV